jgi:hypothetical protein
VRTYNPEMASFTSPLLRQVLLATVCALSTAAACAQTGALPAPSGGTPSAEAQGTAPQDAAQSRAEGRRNQKIQNIHVEDNGAKVDEVRYGGQTQSITVQPKANVPAYEVLPNDGGRERQGQAETGSSGIGARVWNLLKF